jgi:hypothetical protein
MSRSTARHILLQTSRPCQSQIRRWGEQRGEPEVVVEHSGSAAGAMQLGAAAASPVGGLMPAVVVAPPIEIRVWGEGISLRWP